MDRILKNGNNNKILQKTLSLTFLKKKLRCHKRNFLRNTRNEERNRKVRNVERDA